LEIVASRSDREGVDGAQSQGVTKKGRVALQKSYGEKERNQGSKVGIAQSGGSKREKNGA